MDKASPNQSPKNRQRVRDTLTSTVRGPTQLQANSYDMHAEDLVLTLAVPMLAAFVFVSP